MKTLIDGVRRYETFQRPRYQRRFAELAGGQKPHALFIGCADSRVVPDLAFASEPGDLFVVRNVGNLVDDASVTSAVWYATEVLGIRDIVVCGHSGCGAMNALLQPELPDALQDWLSPAIASRNVWHEFGPYDASFAPVDQLSQINARHQIDALRAHVDRPEVRLHAMWFDIAKGQLLAFDEEAGLFVPAVEALARMPSVA